MTLHGQCPTALINLKYLVTNVTTDNTFRWFDMTDSDVFTSYIFMLEA